MNVLSYRQEMKCLREDAYMNGVSLTCCDTGQRLSLFFTLFIYVTLGHKLEVHQIYVVILSYFVVYDSLILLFPKAWYSYKDAYTFAKYIEVLSIYQAKCYQGLTKLSKFLNYNCRDFCAKKNLGQMPPT